MKPSRPIRARISLAALRHNYRLAKQRAPAAKAWAVIKADAYGHGQWRVVQALRDAADGFALLECENAVTLREAGVRQPLLLLEGIFSARDARALVEYNIDSVVHCPEQLDVLLDSVPAAAPLRLHLKLNTGMNRLGLNANQLKAALARLQDRPEQTLTLMTHFAEADGERGVDEQLAVFRRMTQGWHGAISLANSACLLRHPNALGDWVRPGIMLYGASPFAEVSAETLALAPVMALESAVIGIQNLAAGDRVGYGGTFIAEHPMRIGIVACGYADGYPRHAPTGTPIMVGGTRTRLLGRVSMDMLAVDLSVIPDAAIGTPVTLWGRGQAGYVPAEEVAAAAGTIAYELFCGLAARVPVTVVD